MNKYYENKYTDGFFNVSSENGFLPIKDPLKTLPTKYCNLQLLIDDLHVFQDSNNISDSDKSNKGILGIPNEIENVFKKKMLTKFANTHS